jgi:hypothetical protein
MPDTELESTQSSTLVIIGAALDPSAVTASLKWQPWQSWRKGERKSFVRADGTRHVFDSTHEWGGWKLLIPDLWRDRELTDQLQYWTKTLKPKAQELRSLQEGGATIELNCCLITSAGTTLRVPAEVQRELSALGVDLDITFYAHETKESAV